MHLPIICQNQAKNILSVDGVQVKLMVFVFLYIFICSVCFSSLALAKELLKMLTQYSYQSLFSFFPPEFKHYISIQ